MIVFVMVFMMVLMVVPAGLALMMMVFVMFV